MEETDQRKTIAMPAWMCERIESSAAENARSFTGEVNARLAASFGMKPNGLRLIIWKNMVFWNPSTGEVRERR